MCDVVFENDVHELACRGCSRLSLNWCSHLPMVLSCTVTLKRRATSARCRGEWQLDAAVHNLRKLHRDSVRRARNAGNSDIKARNQV